MSIPCRIDRDPITHPDATCFRVGDAVRIISTHALARVTRILDVGGYPLYVCRFSGSIRAAGGWFSDELELEREEYS